MVIRRGRLVDRVMIIGLILFTQLGVAWAQGSTAEVRRLASVVYVKGDAKVSMAPPGLDEPRVACDAWTRAWQDVSVDDVIPDQTFIRTGTHSRVKVRLGDVSADYVSTVTLCACTTIRLAPLVELLSGCILSDRKESSASQTAEALITRPRAWRSGTADAAVTRVAYHGGRLSAVTPETEWESAPRARGVITPNAVAFETDTTFLTVYTNRGEPRTEVLVYDGRVEVKHLGADTFDTVFENFRALLRGPRELIADATQIADGAVVPDEIDPAAQQLSLEVGGSPQASSITPDTSPLAPSIIGGIGFPQ